MAAIYLKHPRHGSKVACGEAEAVYDEGNGWKRFDPDERKGKTPVVEDTAPKKRGRPRLDAPVPTSTLETEEVPVVLEIPSFLQSKE